MANKDRTIFAFDVGTGSLGIAVREGDKIKHAASLLIDHNIGVMQEERTRRRFYRTRLAHKHREKSLRKLWEDIGEQPLVTSHYDEIDGKYKWVTGDERMHREFPKKDDETIYTSCLLRILLLEGKPLETWQIYKALHAAIQRRGYDSKVPWRTTKTTTKASEEEAKNQKKEKAVSKEEKEEAESQKKAGEFKQNLKGISPNPAHHFPCYYDAYQIKMWEPDKGIICKRIDGNKRPAPRHEGYTAPREMVDKEIRLLLQQASKQLPQLAAHLDSEEKIAQVLYGEDSRDNPGKSQRRYPSTKQTDGLLAQKLPRFDNRVIGKCSIIPRLHVCRKADGRFIRFNFLLGLNNLRYEKISEDGEITTRALTTDKINAIYRECDQQWQDKKKEMNTDFQENIKKERAKHFSEKINKTDKLTTNETNAINLDCEQRWQDKKREMTTNFRKDLEEKRAKCFCLTKNELKKKIKALGGSIKVGHEDIKAPERLKGRCRYSRPALAILHALILSGETPSAFKKKLRAKMKPAKKPIKKADEIMQKNFGNYELKINDYCFRLNQSDLDFLCDDKMLDKKERLYIPQLTLADKYQDSEQSLENKQEILENRKEAIKRLIASCHSPMIRHRLSILNNQLEKLIEQYGEPDHVCIEFIRDNSDDSISSKKNKDKYIAQSNKGKKERSDAIKKLKELGCSNVGELQILKCRLWEQQKHICPYTGDALCSDQLVDDLYEVDHILPRAQECGGPDAMYNKVLTFKESNQEKRDRLPVDWEYILERWGSWQKYGNHIRGIFTDKTDKKKTKLLLATSLEEAQDLAEKYTGLASTGWIARLTRDIIHLRMGWTLGEKGKSRNVTVVSGGQTNKMAQKYELYSCLGDGKKPRVKNRDDNRHHALDAMIISYLQGWMRGESEEDFFKRKNSLPEDEGIDKHYFSEKLDKVYPETIAKQKAAIAEKPLKREGNDRNKIRTKPKIYKNLNKDPKMKRGHWYKSKPVKKQGERTHGCLFIYPADDHDPFIYPLHAFASPHRIQQFYKKKNCRTRLVHRGQLLNVKNDQQLTATQSGGKTTIQSGEYIINKKLKKEYDIVCTTTNNSYRVEKEDLHKPLKAKEAKIRIKNGGEFNFADFKKLPALNGHYKIGASDDDYIQEVTVYPSDNPSEPISIGYKPLFAYMINNIIPEPTLSEGDNITIPAKIKGNNLNIPDNSLPDNTYCIKSFQSGMTTITIENNHGIQYTLSIKKLMKIIDWEDKKSQAT